MKRSLYLLAAVAFLVLSCGDPITPENPISDDPSNNTEIPDNPDTPGDDPVIPGDDPDTPDNPGDPEDPDIPDTGEDDSYSGTVTPYTGEMASDQDKDVVDTENSDIYWEADNDFSNTVKVTFDGTKAKVSTSNSSILTRVDGAYATVDFQTNSVAGVNIIVQGVTTDGGLKIYGNKKHMITLNGCEITSKSGPAINDQCHKRVFVHAMPGTTNRLTDASNYTGDKYYIDGATSETEDSKACFFSEGNMIFSGTGAIVATGNHSHAIASDGFAWIRHGVTMVLESKANDCLHANGDAEDGIGIYVAGGYIYAKATAAAGKCINCDYDVVVGGGKLDLSTTGGVVVNGTDVSSSMCIKSDLNVYLVRGDITCSSTGQAGKGVKAGNDSQTGNLVIGSTSGDGPNLKVSTTGSAYGSSGGGPGGGGGGWPGGGGWGGGGGSSSASSKPKAMKATGTVTVYGGNIEITTTQTEGEGLESKTKATNSIVLNGGNLYLKCNDDCINSAGQIVVNGANVFAWSTNNDAVDSNYGKSSSIVINSGVVIAHAATSPEEALDCDNDAYITIKGGTVFTSGGQQGGGGGWGGSSSSSPSHSQPLSKLSGKSVSTGYFTVTDSDGKIIMSCYVPRSISQNYSYLSSPEFTSGKTYKYGVLSSAPSNADYSWSTYFYSGGTATVSAGTINPS